jgi:hypothetical protein
VENHSFVSFVIFAAVLDTASCDPEVSVLTGGGGSHSASTGAAAQTTTTTSTSTSGGGCAIEMTVDGGSAAHWSSVCASAYGADLAQAPIAYFSYPDGGPPYAFYQLVIQGCADAGPNAEGVRLGADGVMGPGTFTMGNAAYVDPTGTVWSGNGQPFQFHVSALEQSPSGSVDGTFSTIVAFEQSVHSLTGTFHACRVADQVLP